MFYVYYYTFIYVCIYRYRFDEIGLTPEMYSDSDSLSYNSLSRSSSLIQFESLERQLLQNETNNQQGTQSGSVPILSGSSSNENSSKTGANVGLSEFERMLCRKNTNNLLQSQVVVPDVVVVVDDEDEDERDNSSDNNSYSSGVDESTGSSSFSSEESYYLNHSSDKNSEDDDDEEELNEEIIKVGNRNISRNSVKQTQGCVNVIAFNRRFSGSTTNNSNASCSVNRNIVNGSCVSNNGNNVRNKNSVESLSEDSGFCDQSITNSLRRVKSKSNPSLNVLDNGHFSHNAILTSHPIDDDIFCKSMEDLSNMETKMKNNNKNRGTTKIIESRHTDSKNNCQNSVSERNNHRRPHTTTMTTTTIKTTSQRKIVDVKDQQEKIGSRQKRVKSSSSPELRSADNKTSKFDENSTQNDLFHISSVPNNLNLCGDPGAIASNTYNNKISSQDSIATHNVNLFNLNSPISSTPSVIPINPSLTASYANLTLLNYSDDNYTTMATGNGGSSDILTNRKYSNVGSPDPVKSEFSSLLEEITAHFDRNLSILNDQQEGYEPSVK